MGFQCGVDHGIDSRTGPGSGVPGPRGPHPSAGVSATGVTKIIGLNVACGLWHVACLIHTPAYPCSVGGTCARTSHLYIVSLPLK